MTSPQTVVEVPVDADTPLREISQEDPADFVPAQPPEIEPNPDWGMDIILDITRPTGGTLVYVVEERFAAASEFMKMKDAFLEKWNGSAWEPVPSKSSQVNLLEVYSIGFAQSRDSAVNYHETELDWTLDYGALSAGDYRLCQTIESATDSATFRTAFHIYREKLPADEEAALERCEAALNALSSKSEFSVILSESAPYGGVYPVKQITKAGGKARADFYVGEFCVSSSNSEDVVFYTSGWDEQFLLNQNRQFLFTEGKSKISQEEITFCSAWADYKGTVYQGLDTFKFSEDGTLASVNRSVQTMDESGSVVDEQINRLEVDDLGGHGKYSVYIAAVGSYILQDATDAQNNSPWGIFFRVDDDLLEPGGGEIWLAVNAIGVSNYTTDGNYWLEKKVGSGWERVGDENSIASWGDETIKLSGKTSVCQVDWSEVYGELDAGVYRMGKHFYNGSESIIQYAEFAIYQTGGVFGDGAEAALARVDKAIEKLEQSNYRVEKYDYGYSDYDTRARLTDVFWKYGSTMMQDYYNDVEKYSHSSMKEPDDSLYGYWMKRTAYPSEYDSVYFPEGYSIISDREIQLVFSYSQDAAYNPCRIYTYRFDEAGNLIEIETMDMDNIWAGRVTRYVVTDTPESEIQAWVEAKKAEN